MSLGSGCPSLCELQDVSHPRSYVRFCKTIPIPNHLAISNNSYPNHPTIRLSPTIPTPNHPPSLTIPLNYPVLNHPRPGTPPPTFPHHLHPSPTIPATPSPPNVRGGPHALRSAKPSHLGCRLSSSQFTSSLLISCPSASAIWLSSQRIRISSVS